MKKIKTVYFFGIIIMLLATSIGATNLRPSDRFSGKDLPMGTISLLATSGKITFLRVSEAKDSWGSKNRQVQAEVIIQLNSQGASKAYGFQLRKDRRAPSYSAMFELLKDAFKNNWTVTIDYLMPKISRSFPNAPRWKAGYIMRVAVRK